MRYPNMVEATFLARPNRFLAHCSVGGEQVVAHVKTTGRCGELLVPGATVYLQHHGDSPGRKTNWSLISVRKGDMLINIDSQAPNQVVEEALRSGVIALPGFGPIAHIRREATVGASRLDFALQSGAATAYIEVKGVTLEEDGRALFPDAPTQRGIKHLEELVSLAEQGHQCYSLFIAQMKGVTSFSPNMRTHPAFGQALSMAAAAGVHILCYDSIVTPEVLTVDDPVPVVL